MSIKILFVTQSLGKGGAERLVLETTRALTSAYPNSKVKIVSLGPENDYPTLSDGLDIEYCNSNVKLSLTGKSNVDISEFEEIVDRFQPDVIHSHTYKAELVSRENPRRGIKYITHVHGPFPEFEPFHLKTLTSKVALTRFFERRRIFKKYHAVNNQFITISSAIDKELRKQMGSKWNYSIHLIPNAIDLNKFGSKPHPPNSNYIELVSVGRMYPIKNQNYLLAVLSFLKRTEPKYNWRLTLVGDGPLKEDILMQAKQLQLEDCLEFTGQTSEVDQHLKKSHLYIQSSKFESFGLAIVEAMAASLPVISLDGGGNRDFIQNEVNGYLFDQNTDPASFAQSIIELIHDEKKYLTMAIEANKTAQQYDIHNYVKQLMELYNS